MRIIRIVVLVLFVVISVAILPLTAIIERARSIGHSRVAYRMMGGRWMGGVTSTLK